MQQYITDALAVLGALYTLASVAASVLPAGKVKSFFTTVALDLSSLKSKV
jgi:hypothetical protein